MSSTFRPEDWVYVADSMGRIGQGYYKNRQNSNQTISIAEFERNRAQTSPKPKENKEQIINNKPVQSINPQGQSRLTASGQNNVQLTPWDNPLVGEETTKPEPKTPTPVTAAKVATATQSKKKAQEEEEKKRKQQQEADAGGAADGDNGGQGIGAGSGGGGGAGGAKVVCTELFRQGLMSKKHYQACHLYASRHLSAQFMKGYHFWAVAYVKVMRRSPLASRLILPFAVARAKEVTYRLDWAHKGSLMGKLICGLHDRACSLLGYLVDNVEYQQLYENAKTA
ncbi:hypothetical protein MTBPR1_20255 [Candidatus Terasakiella magnetica]|uniref:Uncharacterized protein n=1 Tax=Candidatus Terasakiella magnetica TaxID=1867952 RepID=A0A1C3RGH7_9PROT|nr:hypothetical protein [Candidatus Terasakiella magnetica]SCA56407.1 hypothetical protein MTBPR1_20255 [Candidatus Terasakiella magnetica]